MSAYDLAAADETEADHRLLTVDSTPHTVYTCIASIILLPPSDFRQNSPPRILATGRLLPIAEELLSPYGVVETAASTDEASLIPLMDRTIALVVRGIMPISRRVIEAGPHLRVIGRTGVGYDNVDIAAATERGIPVVFAPGAGVRAVAEGTLMMLLALAKRLRELDENTRAGKWSVRDEITMGDLYDATLGIIGLGRIGSEVARLAQGFGMRILSYDPVIGGQAAERIGTIPVTLEDLLRTADFVSVHASLNEHTRGLLDRQRISLMKRGSMLVNVARGGLTASLDVLDEALESGQLSAVGLDVYPSEPPDISHPIFRRRNVLCTPHCMGLSRKAAEATFRMVGRGMAEVLSGGTPNNVVNPEVFSCPKEREVTSVSKQ